MPLCAAFAGTRKKQLSCVVLLIGLALPAVALIMTYSRSGWISLMLAAFVYIWLRNKKLIPLFYRAGAARNTAAAIDDNNKAHEHSHKLPRKQRTHRLLRAAPLCAVAGRWST